MTFGFPPGRCVLCLEPNPHAGHTFCSYACYDVVASYVLLHVGQRSWSALVLECRARLWGGAPH